MDRARAAGVIDDWVRAHLTVEAPSRAAIDAVAGALALVPEPEAMAAVTPVDGRPRIAVLACEAVFLVWAVPPSAGTAEAARTRRVPLDPGATAVELSARCDLRHWSFEIDAEPLVFRTTGDDEPERFARALAGALGWPQ
jgi:hypothetical protein